MQEVMKLLLTSAGITNRSLADALSEIAGKELRFAYIPTAANLEAGDKHWLITNLVELQHLGSVDIVDIAALPFDRSLPRLEQANVLVFGGGNPFYLMRWIRQSGLIHHIRKLLETRVYVGISAGSMVANPLLSVRQSQNLYSEDFDKTADEAGLGLVDFFTLPHLNSQHFPKMIPSLIDGESKGASYPIYALDDQSGLQVVNGAVQAISEGTWHLHGK